MTAVGFKSDVEVFNYVYMYLQRVIGEYRSKMDKKVREVYKAQGAVVNKYFYEYVNNYVLGVVDSVCYTVYESRKQFQNENTGCRDLIVVKKADVDNYMESELGKMKTFRTKQATDAGGYEMGYKDGKDIQINDGIADGETLMIQEA
jgi:hypothetical protein